MEVEDQELRYEQLKKEEVDLQIQGMDVGLDFSDVASISEKLHLENQKDQLIR